ncbi:MAG: hypothetical protein ACI376_08585 [Candidatus Bruticola sp.]
MCKSQLTSSEAWRKLNPSSQDMLFIASDNEEGLTFCRYAYEHNLIKQTFYADNSDQRRRQANAQFPGLTSGPISQLKEAKGKLTEGYGFTKGLVTAHQLNFVDQAAASLAKGSVLMLRSSDPQPPILSFSTSRLHYDQLTIMGG